MCLYKINYTKQSNNENHIEIVNVSDTTLTNLKLLLDMPLPTLTQCVIVRERGSLSFAPPIKLIELGNLSPHESAHFYYTLQTTDSSVDEELILKQFQFFYDELHTETSSKD